MAAERKMTFGVIVGNRGFFPDHLAKTGREEILSVLQGVGATAIVLGPEQSKYGAVETYTEAQHCAELFKKHADEIDGIIVTLPNFGEERGIVDAIRLSGLKVPVLVQATPDRSDAMTIATRRDSFCGKMSCCNNMMQYEIEYSLTTLHTEAVNSAEFKADLEWFSAVCRIVKGLKNLRIGAIGARPTAFNTVRYSERIFETSGITIETIDLSEIFGRINRMKDNDDAAQAKLSAIKKYVTTQGIPDDALLKMAKLGAVIENWMKTAPVTISAVQCWTSMEEYFGVVPCTVMSMMSNELIPSACEVDVPGTLSMYMLTLASQTPSALLDWNNNYGSDPNKCVCFHCSNLPKHFFQDVKMDYQEIIAGTVGKLNTFGTCVGRVKPGVMSYARYSTDDRRGIVRGYTGAGRFTEDPLETFGGAGVAEIPQLQKLLKHICREGFEHHVAANFSDVSRSIHEAARYLGWESYYHPGE
ncbi:L-fucose/L-arabinose isomerase family protein [Occallatibacter savannae]|uniref:L-fucose/L-arabinose isomerase family protein n=1 Tax=Occallatibacter savannae TaxID=1002691 RepID=UPI00195259D4|nr:L-fucose/L-arabinose isomerase family protein [Occallatibacter savannae]